MTSSGLGSSINIKYVIGVSMGLLKVLWYISLFCEVNHKMLLAFWILYSDLLISNFYFYVYFGGFAFSPSYIHPWLLLYYTTLRFKLFYCLFLPSLHLYIWKGESKVCILKIIWKCSTVRSVWGWVGCMGVEIYRGEGLQQLKNKPRQH